MCLRQQLNPAQPPAEALQSSVTALTHPAQDTQGESPGTEQVPEQQWSCVGPCFEQVSSVAWESNPEKTSIHTSKYSLKIYSVIVNRSGKKGQGKKGLRNGTDITGSECSPPVICLSIRDKACIDKALTVYDFIIF